jgi:hypothetical protein
MGLSPKKVFFKKDSFEFGDRENGHLVILGREGRQHSQSYPHTSLLPDSRKFCKKAQI